MISVRENNSKENILLSINELLISSGKEEVFRTREVLMFNREKNKYYHTWLFWVKFYVNFE